MNFSYIPELLLFLYNTTMIQDVISITVLVLTSVTVSVLTQSVVKCDWLLINLYRLFDVYTKLSIFVN